ncbi:MAG: hypothetical protein WBE52_04240, partial [Terriglobales bacterium]
AITGPYRQLNPEDNNERQSIHEHVSVPLSILNDAPAKRLVARATTNRVGTGVPLVQAGHGSEAARVTATSGVQR